ncbi:MAG TPA: hypothetical protein VHH73_14415 [Verrucomicrobiae bacterium]|nr:hypothetical protein [Verrucomicrobiae bacterium]
MLAILLGWSGIATAEDLVATLEVIGAHAKQTATSEQPKTPRKGPPAVLAAKPDEEMTLHWTVQNKGKQKFEDLLVHFFVTRANPAGVEGPPDMRPDKVVIEGALTLDMAANSTTGTLSFRVHDPGMYIVRVEVEGPKTVEFIEPVATLDLEVK